MNEASVAHIRSTVSATYSSQTLWPFLGGDLSQLCSLVHDIRADLHCRQQWGGVGAYRHREYTYTYIVKSSSFHSPPPSFSSRHHPYSHVIARIQAYASYDAIYAHITSPWCLRGAQRVLERPRCPMHRNSARILLRERAA